MGILAGKIVLTGGPCAGKTTALTRIEQDLTERGYRVFVISESATELIKGGVRPFGNSPVGLLKFQELILQYQLKKESVYEQAVKSLPPKQKCVIICDRGIMDNKAYINSEQFAAILKEQNLNELELMDSYNLIIHMVTAADGKAEYYTLENNQARTESVSEAIALDDRTSRAWMGHNNLKIIDNSTDFDEKISRAMDSIHSLLGNPTATRRQRKFLIDLSKSDLSFLDSEDSNQIYMVQTYLDFNDQRERRLRKRTMNGQNTYCYTVAKKETDGLATIYLDKTITEKEYLKLLAMDVNKCEVRKTRYTFKDSKQYYRLDIFDDQNEYAILEVEPNKTTDIIIVPSHLDVIDDVTNNEMYRNSNMAQKQKELTLKKLTS